MIWELVWDLVRFWRISGFSINKTYVVLGFWSATIVIVIIKQVMVPILHGIEYDSSGI